MALVASVPQSVRPSERAAGDPAGFATEPDDGVDNEERWAMMFDLVGEVDFDSVLDSGLLGRPGTAERALMQLTSTEREELLRLLRDELGSGG